MFIHTKSTLPVPVVLLYVNPKTKIQIELSSDTPTAYVWLWTSCLIFKGASSAASDLSPLTMDSHLLLNLLGILAIL